MLLLLDEVFHKCQLDLVDIVLFSSTTFLHIFRLLDLSITEEIFKFPTITTDLSISTCGSFSFCLVSFDVLLLGTYLWKTGMLSWKIDFFIIM